MKNYAEVYAKCPFFDKTDRGYIQCEGIVYQSHTRTLFHDLKDGHPLDRDRDDYLDRYCNKDYEDCAICKMLMEKYEEIEKMNKLYECNKDFRDYVDKYCETHKICKEVAFEHAIIKAIALVYDTMRQKHSEGGTIY